MVTLQDVATVRRTFKERASHARYNGRDTISIGVNNRANANVIDSVSEASRGEPAYEPPEGDALTVVGLGAVSRKQDARTGAGKYRGETRGLSVRQPTYAMAKRSDLSVESEAGAAAAGSSYTAVAESYESYVAAHPSHRGRRAPVG